MKTRELLLREGIGLVRALGGVRLGSVARFDGDGMPVIVGNGYMAHYLPLGEHIYDGLVNYLNTVGGYRAALSQVKISWADYKRLPELIDKELNRLFPGSDLVTGIGHSYGAFALLYAKIHGVRIGNILALGPPWHGTKLKLLESAVQKTTGATVDLLEKHWDQIAAVAPEIENLYSPHDLVVNFPDRRKHFPEMTYTNVKKEIPGRKVSHIGLVTNRRMWPLITSRMPIAA